MIKRSAGNKHTENTIKLADRVKRNYMLTALK